MSFYALYPSDSHKSFYGKAHVLEIRGKRYLKSYETIVMYQDRNGKYHRTWSGFSATSGRHIAAFSGLNKRAFLALPFEKLRITSI